MIGLHKKFIPICSKCKKEDTENNMIVHYSMPSQTPTRIGQHPASPCPAYAHEDCLSDDEFLGALEHNCKIIHPASYGASKYNQRAISRLMYYMGSEHFKSLSEAKQILCGRYLRTVSKFIYTAPEISLVLED